MKAKLVPVFFKGENNEEFYEQVKTIAELLKEEADILEPVELGLPLPDADAVVFPRLVGAAYKQIGKVKKISLPIIIITSEFGTVAMWDWEIITFFRSHGINTITPYNLELSKTICRSFAIKQEMKQTKFLVFQDTPGDGMQASIFKRFYWWEDECIDRIKEKFGITLIKKSYKELAENAKNISDNEVEAAVKERTIDMENVSQSQLYSAMKLYLAIKYEVEKDNSIQGVGINCLNESFYSDTTPCLAWNLLFEEKQIFWACEADIMCLLTKYIIYKSVRSPIVMSNLYPFLAGMAAIKHEKIDAFPEVEDPQNHVLVVHCGYVGLIPKCFASKWMFRPKVLEIVDENATVLDAELPKGDITLVKLHPTLNKIQVIEAELEEYVQYPGTDCRNGAVLKVSDGYKLMDELYSHHSCLVTGNKIQEIKFMAKVLGLDIDIL